MDLPHTWILNGMGWLDSHTDPLIPRKEPGCLAGRNVGGPQNGSEHCDGETFLSLKRIELQ